MSLINKKNNNKSNNKFHDNIETQQIDNTNYTEIRKNTEVNEVDKIDEFDENDLTKKQKKQLELRKHHEKGYKKIAYYANWKNLIYDIKKMGFVTSTQKIVGIMGIYTVIVALISIIMKLNPLCPVIMFGVGFLIMPLLIVNSYKKVYEDNRFSEVSQYIEQMLYSFKNTNKVLKSLQDIRPMFKDSPMGNVIDNVINDIPIIGVEEALKHFEKAYDCQKIRQLNEFLVEVEQVGGEHDNSIKLLLDDRKLWVNRTLEYEKERNHKKVTIFISIIASFALCCIMEKVLPAEADITNNLFYHISAVALFIVDLILYYITDNFCAVSLLNNIKSQSDEDIKKYYEYIVNYNSKTELIKGLRVAPIGLLITVCGFLFKENIIAILGIIFAVFCIFKSKITYKTRFNAIKSEIEIQFPRWLMQVALYVQSNSVQVALYKSIPSAPLVLQPELIKLNNSIRDNPTSIDPYLDFMKDFDLPDITNSMKMFYSIASGAGSDVQEQVNEIIERNNNLLDKTEKIANDNLLGKMYILFLMPQLTGGFKIIVDMIIFFAVFMSSSMTL